MPKKAVKAPAKNDKQREKRAGLLADLMNERRKLSAALAKNTERITRYTGEVNVSKCTKYAEQAIVKVKKAEAHAFVLVAS